MNKAVTVNRPTPSLSWLTTVILLAATASTAGCVRDGLAGFACNADGTCDEGLECVSLAGRSLLNGRDRDVCRLPELPPFRLRATTEPCCGALFIAGDFTSGLRIALPEDQAPLSFRPSRFGDDIVLVTEAIDDIGELSSMALCVRAEQGERVALCGILLDEDLEGGGGGLDDEPFDPRPGLRWQQSTPALDGDEAHVSFRSAENAGFLRHASFEIFAQADTGPPFIEDASWIAEPLPSP